VRDVAVGVAKSEITADESIEKEIAAGLPTKTDVIGYARSCRDEANTAVAGMGDAEINAMVPTPWDMTFPGWMAFHLLRDELLHHRGQLYVYARLCGVAPPPSLGPRHHNRVRAYSSRRSWPARRNRVGSRLPADLRP